MLLTTKYYYSNWLFITLTLPLTLYHSFVLILQIEHMLYGTELFFHTRYPWLPGYRRDRSWALFCSSSISMILHSTQQFNIGLYSNDSTLYKSDYDLFKVQMNLQKSLCAIDNWCKTNNMMPNPAKSTCMIITTTSKHRTLINNLTRL